MTPETVKAGPVARTDLRNPVLANHSEHIRLEALRASYLKEVFGLPSDTASVLAELAFGGANDH